MSDPSILLGVIGIVVSIVVGYGTYWLTEKRARRNRWQGAKDMVLRDLSKSLGEGTVPEPKVILATIRSVLRGHNAPDLAAVTFEEVRDDLIRQITADPFIDADRRKELLAQILNLQAPEPPAEPPEVGPGAQAEALRFSVGALMSGLVASILAGLSFSGLPALLERVQREFTDEKLYLLLVPIIATAITFVATLVSEFKRKSRE